MDLNNNVQILVFRTEVFGSSLEQETSSGCIVHVHVLVLVPGTPGFKTAVCVYEYRFAEYEYDLVAA